MLRTVMQRSFLRELYSSKLSENKLGYIHATIIIIVATETVAINERAQTTQATVLYVESTE